MDARSIKTSPNPTNSDAELLSCWLAEDQNRISLSNAVRKAVANNNQGLEAEDIENDILLQFFESLPASLRESILVDSAQGHTDTINYFYTAAKHRAFPSAKNATKEKRNREALRLDDETQPVEHIDALAYRDAFSSVHANHTLFKGESKFFHALALKVDGYSEHEICSRLGYADNKTLNRALKSRKARKEIFVRIYPYISESLCSTIREDYETWLFNAGENSDAALARIDEHIASCSRCESAHNRNKTYLRAHALMLPLPMIAAGGGEGAEGYFTSLWHSLSSRFGDAGTTITTQASSGNWHSAKPLATAAALVTLVGGGAYVTTQPANDQATQPAKRSAAASAPTSLLDEIKQKPAAKKKVKRKTTRKPSRPAAPQPAPAPARPPAAEPTPIDDGSSEFLPEGR